MQREEKITTIYLICLLPFGLLSAGWAVVGFPHQIVDVQLVLLAAITVFLSSYLRIQLPRTNIHLTMSDALVFLSFLLYGAQVAVILAVLETLVTSLNFRRLGVTMKIKTVMINVLVAAVSVRVTALVVDLGFGEVRPVIENGSFSLFVALLAIMATTQFLVNSICVAGFVALKTSSTIWRVWNEYCLNALVLYLCGAIMAALSFKALEQINIFLFAGAIGFCALVFLTYKRYTRDVYANGALAEQAERERAEQAEAHLSELQHYVLRLEKSAEALSESREKFRHAAFHDALTGLPNRNRFLDELTIRLDKCRERPEQKFAVLFLDLNRFKTLNESLGHSVGDRLIINVAARLNDMKGEDDLVGRFSGDEFAILLAGNKGTAEVTQFAEEVASIIAEPYDLFERQVYTSVSIGIAFGNAVYESAEEILRDADIAMYYAKETQKSFVIFDREMHARAVSLLELETDLRRAIERREFELYYQPIVNLDDVQLSGFEALVRWNHPQRGLVPPNEFIELAESTGLIIPMTVELLRSACAQIAIWQESWEGAQPLTVSVNLSVKHFAHVGLVEQILAAVEESGVDPSMLRLEITESAIMENAEAAIQMLQRIKMIGVKLSIDDFGTGYSSLSYLHRFPIDTLKVDRSFVSTMEEGSENGEIVRTVIALARALKLNVIAEGIESIHQFHQLRILGCEYGQGYLFARPLPVAEIEKLLADTYRWRNILPINEFGAIARNAEYTQMRIQ